MTKRPLAVFLLVLWVAMGIFPPCARAEKIRDLVSIVGVFPVQLEGFGVVTGLSGKGDKSKAALRAIRNYMERLGMAVNEADLAVGNLAFVRVTATLPPWKTVGTFVTAQVSAINGSTDLTNGNLQSTDLFVSHGRDAQRYAKAYGKLVVHKGDLTNALLPATQNGGAQVVMARPELPVDANGEMVFALNRPNVADSAAIARAINESPLNPYRRETRGYRDVREGNQEKIAWALDFGKVQVRIPRAQRTRETEFIDELFRLDVSLDRPPSIVFNQATGFFSLIGDVRIETRGLASIKGKTVTLSPPAPPGNPNDRVYTLDDGTPRNLVELGGHGTEVELQKLVSTLNAMGVDSTEVGEIFRRLCDQGAIRAEFKLE